LRTLLSLTCCLLAISVAAATAPSPSSAATGSDRKRQAPVGARAAEVARTLLGIPYRSGGTSPQTGFDCSGFVQYVYAEVGVTLPHYSGSQWNLGRPVDTDRLIPGDLVFFDQASHVGIYIGDGFFVHAPHTGARVRVDAVSSSWYGATFDGARRLV
jgi:cell wall-associated NlpC family hydrolase